MAADLANCPGSLHRPIYGCLWVDSRLTRSQLLRSPVFHQMVSRVYQRVQYYRHGIHMEESRTTLENQGTAQHLGDWSGYRTAGRWFRTFRIERQQFRQVFQGGNQRSVQRQPTKETLTPIPSFVALASLGYPKDSSRWICTSCAHTRISSLQSTTVPYHKIWECGNCKIKDAASRLNYYLNYRLWRYSMAKLHRDQNMPLDEDRLVACATCS